jgi:hypothetical protein
LYEDWYITIHDAERLIAKVATELVVKKFQETWATIDKELPINEIQELMENQIPKLEFIGIHCHRDDSAKAVLQLLQIFDHPYQAEFFNLCVREVWPGTFIEENPNQHERIEVMLDLLKVDPHCYQKIRFWSYPHEDGGSYMADALMLRDRISAAVEVYANMRPSAQIEFLDRHAIADESYDVIRSFLEVTNEQFLELRILSRNLIKAYIDIHGPSSVSNLFLTSENSRQDLNPGETLDFTEVEIEEMDDGLPLSANLEKVMIGFAAQAIENYDMGLLRHLVDLGIDLRHVAIISYGGNYRSLTAVQYLRHVQAKKEANRWMVGATLPSDIILPRMITYLNSLESRHLMLLARRARRAQIEEEEAEAMEQLANELEN